MPNFETCYPSGQCSHVAYAAPALLSGTIGTRLPDNELWSKAISEDSKTCLIRRTIQNTVLLTNENLLKVHHVYRGALRRSQIVEEDDILYYVELLTDDAKYVKLQIVPKSHRNIVFIAFHSNPIGGHLDAFRTFARMRLRFFFPGMFQYCKAMCKACLGCSLANATKRRSADLIYSFLIQAPMLVLHFNIYVVGAKQNFKGTQYYLIAACGMTGFLVCEPTAKQNAKAFAATLMKIWLRFGISHTIVVDKDSKFCATFEQTAELLKVNIHVLSES